MGSLPFEMPPSWEELRAVTWPHPGSVQLFLGSRAVLSPGEQALPLEHRASRENPSVAEQKLFPRQKAVWCRSISRAEAAHGYSELRSFLHLIFAVVPRVFVVSWCCEGPENSLLYMNG